jgi:hypothetical protein
VRCDTKAIENPFKKSLVKTRCGSVEKTKESKKKMKNISRLRRVGCENSTKDAMEKKSEEASSKNHEIQILSGKTFFLVSPSTQHLPRRGFNFE